MQTRFPYRLEINGCPASDAVIHKRHFKVSARQNHRGGRKTRHQQLYLRLPSPFPLCSGFPRISKAGFVVGLPYQVFGSPSVPAPAMRQAQVGYDPGTNDHVGQLAATSGTSWVRSDIRF